MLKAIILLGFILLTNSTKASPLEAQDAIIANEQLKVLILKDLDKGFLVTARGKEDALKKGDHVLFTLEDRFLARGVAVYSSKDSTLWAIYRAMRPRRFKKDRMVKITTLRRDQIPPEYRYLLGLELKDKNVQSEFNMSEANSNFDLAIDSLRAKIYASPFRIQKVNDVKNINYGLSLYNQNQNFYEMKAWYTHQEYSNTDPLTKNSIKSQSNKFGAYYSKSTISSHWSYFSELEFDTKEQNDFKTIKSRYQITPIGAKYEILKSVEFPQFDISYGPTFERLNGERYDSSLLPEQQIREEYSETNIRHSFRLRIYWNFSEKFMLKETFKIRPAQKLSGFGFDLDDNDFSQELALTFNFNQTAHLSIENQITRDIRQFKYFGIPATDVVTMLSFGLDFDL